MKAMKKLIPALAMLLVSAVVMSSASFAWFTMSRQVTAQGMNVTVTAPNNLMIKKTGADDNTYSEKTDISVLGVKLVPASTKTGKIKDGVADKIDFYVVKEGEAVKTADGSLFTAPDHETKLTAGTAATESLEGAFYDFKYTIKSDGGQNVNVVVNSITVTNNNPSKSVKPVRIAVMTSDENLIKMYKPDDTSHNLSNQVVASIEEENGKPTLENDNTINADDKYTGGIYTVCATNKNDTNYVAQLTSAKAEENIIVRVWYEGQDTDCIVTKGANANFDVKVVLSDVAYLPEP